MAQHDMIIDNASGYVVRQDVNTALQALAGLSSGANAPTMTYAYQWWADTTAGVLRQRNAGNTGWVVRGSLAEGVVVSRSSNAQLTISDYGKTIVATGTWTQTFASASALGDGWYAAIRNAGAGVITLDPSGSEQVDGLTTITLGAGEACLIYSNGTALHTVGRAPLVQPSAATSGTAPAYTLALLPAPTLAAGLRVRVNFHAATTAAATLNVSGTGARPIKQYTGNGAKGGAVIALGQRADVEYDGADWVILDALPSVQATESEMQSGTETGVRSMSPANVKQAIEANTSLEGAFHKADPSTVAFIKTGAGTASIKAGTKVDVAGTLVTFAANTAITMPALADGTDYAIWVKDDATIRATTSFSSAPGTGNWRRIGGFHYAPGGNATANAGGDTTPAINEYSFWDLKFRPACPDPRGMTLVADSFWADIYLLGVDHLTNGTSKYNVSIADGSAPPKIPTKFGGTGSNAYSTLNWWEANEVLQSWGKRSPTYDEFAALAYGTTEATSSGGSDVPTTGVSGTGATNAWNKFTSRWGVIQATGCLYIWGGEFGGGAAGVSWSANTDGRGRTYQMENAVNFGGKWGNTTESGSRCSSWNASPASSYNNLGARGVSDHLILD